MPASRRSHLTASRRPPSPISDGLKAAIEARELGAYGVAVAAGLNPAIVSRWLSGARSLSLESADAIAAALGLKVAEAAARGRGRPPRARSFPQPEPGDN